MQMQISLAGPNNYSKLVISWVLTIWLINIYHFIRILSPPLHHYSNQTVFCILPTKERISFNWKESNYNKFRGIQSDKLRTWEVITSQTVKNTLYGGSGRPSDHLGSECEPKREVVVLTNHYVTSPVWIEWPVASGNPICGQICYVFIFSFLE